MKLIRIAAALLAAGAIGPAAAADLLNVYRDALVSDPVYLAARAQYQAGLEKLPQARAGYLPAAAFSGSAYRNQLDRRDDSPDVNYTNQTYALTLSQPLFRWQNWVVINQAEQLILQNEASFSLASQDLMVRVSQAYLDVLLAQDNVALSDAQKKAISEQLAQAKRNFEVGTATIVDTLEAQARYDQAVAKEVLDQNDLQVKLRALQQLVGKPPGALTPLKDSLLLTHPIPNDIEQWVTRSEEASPAVAVSRAVFQAARQEVDRARAGHFPTVDLAANYTYNKNPNLTSGIGTLAQSSGSVGIIVGVPIFAGGFTQSKVREALALRERSEQDLENTRRSVALLVRQYYLNVTNGIAQVRALEQALTSTKSQLESTILGRDVGVRTSVDVLNAQQQVFQTRRDLQQARYGYILSALRLRAATGTLAEPDLEEVNRRAFSGG